MHIAYLLSHYISHYNAGKDYIECLNYLGHRVDYVNYVSKMTHEDINILNALFEQVDVVIIHNEPLLYPELFSNFPILREKRVIAYAVWESSVLPEGYKKGISLCSEIWTCSEFSASAMRPIFPHVKVVPHVVKRVVPSQQDITWANSLIQKKEKEFLFFSIVDACNPRKNIDTLLKAFIKLQQTQSLPVRLILKQYRMNIDYSSLPHVFSLSDKVPDERIAALHILSDAYISTHHSEGWGLGLSDAMAYGKPVIATGYSGNMEFMNEKNSFPVPYALTHVSERMSKLIPLFTTQMYWADIDESALLATMQKVIRKDYNREIALSASEITKQFGIKSIAATIGSLL